MNWTKLTADFDELQRLAFSRRGSGCVFAVVSWGCAATKWAARVLNSHPDIFCLHEGKAHLSRFGYPTSEKLDGVAYLRLIAAMGSGYAASGDVHGVSRQQVPAIREVFGDCFQCAVLVREPLSRIRSQMALFDDFQSVAAWNLDHAVGLAETYGVTLPSGSQRPRMFLHAANMLNAILEERQVGPIFRAEEITVDPDTLANFINMLTAGKVLLDQEWLRQAVRQPRVNQHSRRGADEMDSWEVDVLGRVVSGDTWQAYAEIGYPLPSFVAPSWARRPDPKKSPTVLNHVPAIMLSCPRLIPQSPRSSDR